MVRLRSCRIGPSVLLALLLTLVNTFVILVYLGPLSLKNEGAPPAVVSHVPSEKIMTSLKENNQKIQQISVVNQVMQKIDFPVVDQKNVAASHNTKKVEIFSDWSKELTASKHEENLDHVYSKLKFDHNVVSMLGQSPGKPVDIVIGIPTVKRGTTDYLSSTLEHLVKNLNKNETKQCHIVVFSANFEQAANDKTAAFIQKKFGNEVSSGLIEVIKPDKAFYSKLTDLPSLWKDKPDRVMWRSKQCLDYSLLFAYCRNLGHYYLQLEDDVSVTKTYFREMKSFIQARGFTKWSNLQFGTSGFIGMLFRTSDLGRLALFVKMYYWIFPVDILFRHYNDIHLYGNSPKDIYRPPLFGHLGRQSSLKGQTRKVEAGMKPKYANSRRYTDATNPPAFISTNIQVFEAYSIDGPYRTPNVGYFWGKNVHLNDFVVIEFMKELTLVRVVVETGSEFAANDFVAEGKLETTDVSKVGNCNEQGYTVLTSTTNNGKIDTNAGAIAGVKCIKLTVIKLNLDDKGKSRWLLIREIAVWTR